MFFQIESIVLLFAPTRCCSAFYLLYSVFSCFTTSVAADYSSTYLLFFFVMGMYKDSSGSSATQAEKEEVDSRSIYVGNVRFIPLIDVIYVFSSRNMEYYF